MRPHNLNGGRPKFVPTKEQQSDVRALASCGNSQAVIANYLHISINTLKLHFAEELSAAAIKANQAVAINLFRIATRGSGAAAVSAIKYWLNSRAKDLWGESVSLDLGCSCQSCGRFLESATSRVGVSSIGCWPTRIARTISERE